MAVQIRAAIPADAPTIADLADRMGLVTSQFLPPRLRGHDGSPHPVALLLSDPESVVFVAEAAGDLAGVVAVARLDASHFLLPMFALRSDHREQGMARVLLARVHRWVAARGGRQIALLPPSDLTMAGLYHDLGYSLSGDWLVLVLDAV